MDITTRLAELLQRAEDATSRNEALFAIHEADKLRREMAQYGASYDEAIIRR
jgi:hypothetical protein